MKHFEILVEDTSGKQMLEILFMNEFGISGQKITYRIISYKGIGRLPKNLKVSDDPAKRQLLTQLPRLLEGYGKSFIGFPAYIIVIIDNDKHDCKKLKNELCQTAELCYPKPNVFFRIAVEEIESWYLGDKDAITKAYTNANRELLNAYKYDSICDTWETLADIIEKGGRKALKKLSYQEIGIKKSNWANQITPYLQISSNLSPSFQCFFRKLQDIINS